jgi:hypothetical protein
MTGVAVMKAFPTALAATMQHPVKNSTIMTDIAVTEAFMTAMPVIQHGGQWGAPGRKRRGIA